MSTLSVSICRGTVPIPPNSQSHHGLSALKCSFINNNSNPILLLRLQQPCHFKPYSKGKGMLVRMSYDAGVGVMGTKLGMMSFFEPNGKVVPVTVVGFKEGNVVTQLKTEATDGYNAVQVGYRRVRDRKLTKPELGHLQKVGAIPMRHLQEFRLVSVDGFEPNQRLLVDEIFKEGDFVDVSGTTIGKGFQGFSCLSFPNFCPPRLFS